MSKGLTQKELAEAVGVSRSAVASWDVGVSHPTAVKLPKVAEILGCTVDDLLKKEAE